jgi:hypothetical protein
MSESEIVLEPQEQKELRKKILELAGQECDSIQNEIKSWKKGENLVNLRCQTTKNKHSSIFDDKIEEIQNKINARKKEKPFLSCNTSALPASPLKLDSSTAHFDQKVSIQSSLLTQELYTRQLQLFQEKHAIEVKNLKENISAMTEKLLRFEAENDAIRENFKGIVFEVEEKLRKCEARLFEVVNENEMLKGKVKDNDVIVKLLEEKLVQAEKKSNEFRQKENELENCRSLLEKERKRREIAENEYKSLIDEVKVMNERSCEQIRVECQAEIAHYKQKVKKLEKLIKRNTETESGKETFKEKPENIQGLVVQNQELSKTVQFYEEKCADLHKQLKMWKVKTLGMAERMLALYKTSC